MYEEKTELQGYVKAETEKAILFDYDGDEVWIPKSLVSSGINDGDYIIDDYLYTIEIPLYFAKKKGMI